MSESLNFEQTLNRWQQERVQRLQIFKDAAANVVKSLRAKGITCIEFDYCGSGDEGCIEDCRIEGSGTMLKEEQETLEDLVYALLPSGWEINEGSTGTVSFDLKTGKVSQSHKWLEYVEDNSVSSVQLDLSN